MSKMDPYFVRYAAFHRTKGNQACHLLGVPMIAIAILGWASHWIWLASSAAELPLSLFRLDLGVAIIVLASLRYIYLDWKKGLPFVLVLFGLYWIGRALPGTAIITFFVVGWIFQLVGHVKYEKNSPAFLQNLEHILTAPIWIFSKYVRL